MLGVLPFVEDPDLSWSAAPALPQHLPPCPPIYKYPPRWWLHSAHSLLFESSTQPVLPSGRWHPLPHHCHHHHLVTILVITSTIMINLLCTNLVNQKPICSTRKRRLQRKQKDDVALNLAHWALIHIKRINIWENSVSSFTSFFCIYHSDSAASLNPHHDQHHYHYLHHIVRVFNDNHQHHHGSIRCTNLSNQY